ncbi:MAG: hypothetical protein L0Y71_10205 [Gemmataceae bacterium]|nr:hypothetical protein [Gemmataceae bacterium]
MSASTLEYDMKRAETLTQLVLTRRRDVNLVFVGTHQQLGFDFLATVGQPIGKGILPTFGVEVRATPDPLDDQSVAVKFLTQNWKHRHSKGFPLCPIVVFLFSVENDQGYWSWLMEPSVSKDGRPTLDRVSEFDLKKITGKSIDGLIHRVEEWYQAVVETIVKNDSK